MTITSNTLESAIERDYLFARQLYSNLPATTVGSLVLGLEDVKAAAIDLTTVMDAAIGSIRTEPDVAAGWAKTFGALQIGIASDVSETSFRFKCRDASGARPIELATTESRNMADFLRYTQQDGPRAYVLADEGPQKAEYLLIKALHMLDFDMALQGFQAVDVQSPVMFTATTDQLVEVTERLKTRMRVYGNVRNNSDAPLVLGAVLDTGTLEGSGIELPTLLPPEPIASVTSPEQVASERQSIKVVGITSAKKPHIGHLFLLAKAMSGSEKLDVYVELNDKGNRVAQAVARYATINGISFDAAEKAMTAGEASFESIEQAYQQRDASADVPVLDASFSLSEANRYYRLLLDELSPEEQPIQTVADSELQQDSASLFKLGKGVQSIFQDPGMTVLQAPETGQVTVLQSADQLTVGGIIAALSSKFQVTMVDSPKPLDSRARKIFADNGIAVGFEDGIGVSIGFDVASGTKNNSVTVEELMRIAAEMDAAPELILPASRLMMQRAMYIPGDGGSLNPQYASADIVKQKFATALSLVQTGYPCEFSDLQLRDITRSVLKDFLSSKVPRLQPKGKLSADGVQQLIRLFPEIGLSDRLKSYAANPMGGLSVVPKSVPAPSDYNVLQAVREARPKVVFELLERLAKNRPDALEEILAGTSLMSIFDSMGYELSDAAELFGNLKNVKAIYNAA